MSTRFRSDAQPTVLPALTSQRQMRDLNAAVILGSLWDTPVDVPVTATELVEDTGMTRATVLSICDELLDQGWVTEHEASADAPSRGRKARRFTFNHRRHLIAAADVGFRSVSAAIADLKGNVLGYARTMTLEDMWNIDRTTVLINTLNDAITQAKTTKEHIAAAGIGLAAPVALDGTTYPTNPPNALWETMKIDQQQLHHVFPHWHTQIENDANLAALAEQHVRPNNPNNPMVTLLSGDRFGAGIIINGELLRGFNGGAGEMGYLQEFSGGQRLQSPIGSLGMIGSIRALMNDLAQDKPQSLLWEMNEKDAERPNLDDIVDASEKGDALATTIVGRIRDHVTATILPLSHIIEPGVVIIAGGAAPQAAALIPAIESKLAQMTPFPPAIEISSLGRDVVLIGAIRSAIQQIRRSVITN